MASRASAASLEAARACFQSSAFRAAARFRRLTLKAAFCSLRPSTRSVRASTAPFTCENGGRNRAGRASSKACARARFVTARRYSRHATISAAAYAASASLTAALAPGGTQRAALPARTCRRAALRVVEFTILGHPLPEALHGIDCGRGHVAWWTWPSMPAARSADICIGTRLHSHGGHLLQLEGTRLMQLAPELA